MDLEQAAGIFLENWIGKINLTLVALIAFYVQAFFCHRLWVRTLFLPCTLYLPGAEYLAECLCRFVHHYPVRVRIVGCMHCGSHSHLTRIQPC
jgi:hypothetical protein